MRRVVLLVLLAPFLFVPRVEADPVFTAGFAALASQIPDIVGLPLEAEWHGPNGDGLQRTTTGLMVWRKADNWTAFTNGSRTWVNGPFGVQSRSNDQRFEWEAASPPPDLPPPPRPSGVPMPVGDIEGWRQVFAEDFNLAASAGGFPGIAYSSKWSVYPDGWRDTSKRGTYVPSKVLSVHDGLLDYHLHTDGRVHMVAAAEAKVPSGVGRGQTYGRFEVRFRADRLPGYKIAFLLWPDSEKWPDDGEIDFPEGFLDGTITAHAHHASPSDEQEIFGTNATFDSWHTATIEWTPGKVSFYMDGKPIGTSTRRVPAKSMHWVLQAETAVGGAMPNDSTAGHVEVDWVVAYVPR